LIPNKRTHLRYNNYDYFVNTNSLGFASPEISPGLKKTDEIRIMITGDAFSMPEGMEYEYSYPALLERKLKNQFPNKTIKVINAGVTGYGPNEVYGQVKKFIDILNPDIIINEMFINEFLEINLTRTERLEEIGLLKTVPEKKRIREKVQMLGNFQLAIQVPFYFKNLFGLNEEYNYNKSLLFFYEKDSQLYNDSVITKLNNYLFDMKEICTISSSELIVLGVPGQVEVSEPKHISYFPESVNINDTTIFDLSKPLLILENLCKNNDISYLDSKTVLKNNPEQPLYFEKSWHWNKKGHEVIADFLFENLKTNNKLN
jgi:lysophospholipase L1-like esterase